jgi:hypothetical protein
MAVRTGAGREEELQRGSARFAEWRRTRRRGTPIPVELWELAVELAERYGVSRTSQALPVGYYALQARVAACGQFSDDSKSVPAVDCSPVTLSPKFVELPAATLGAPVECVVEFEKPGGAKLRIHVRSSQLPDLSALGRAFWESR